LTKCSEHQTKLSLQRPASSLRIPLSTSLNMIRTTLLRSARTAARSAPRWQSPIAKPVARSSLFQSKQITPVACFQAVRCYSAHGGMSKDEVQGRILDLLKNFDKVCAAGIPPGRLTQWLITAIAGQRYIKGTFTWEYVCHIKLYLTHISSPQRPTFRTTLAWTALILWRW